MIPARKTPLKNLYVHSSLCGISRELSLRQRWLIIFIHQKAVAVPQVSSSQWQHTYVQLYCLSYSGPCDEGTHHLSLGTSFSYRCSWYWSIRLYSYITYTLYIDCVHPNWCKRHKVNGLGQTQISKIKIWTKIIIVDVVFWFSK